MTLTKRSVVGIVFLFASVALGSPRTAAQEDALDRAVAAVDPALVQMVHDGNVAMDRGDPVEASRVYATVHDHAPTVVGITRRLCTAEARSGNAQSGIKHCREALAAEASAENHAALASALVRRRPLDDADADEALEEAKAAVKLVPWAEFAAATLCEAAYAKGDMRTLEECTAALKQFAPQGLETHLYAALVSVEHKDFDTADVELTAAKAAGLSPDVYDAVHKQIEETRPRVDPVARTLTVTGAGYIAALFLLFVLGLWLGDSAPKTKSRVVRGFYRVLLIASSLFFYVTVLVIGMGLLFVTGIGGYIFVQLTEPTRLVQIIAGVVSAYVLLAVLRASFARVPAADDSGTSVKLDKQPKLRDALKVVAKALGQRTIDEVYLRPNAAIEVIERGGAIGHLRERNPRVLFIGWFALEGLTQRAFAALVATELARYAGAGSVAVVERRTLEALEARMQTRGVVTAANPAWWIVGGFKWFFDQISDGAVALQEIGADEQAAKFFGGSAVVEGLKHLVSCELDYEARAAKIMREALDHDAEPGDTREAFDDVWKDYTDRAKRIAKLDPDGSIDDEDEDEEPVWDLFSNRDVIERSMNERLQTSVETELGITKQEATP